MNPFPPRTSRPDPLEMIEQLCTGLDTEKNLSTDYSRWYRETMANFAATDADDAPVEADPVIELETVNAILDRHDPSSRKPGESTAQRVERVISIYKKNR